ncbi:MAG: hypothetical protein FGF53_01030 [Candidatus Brockarchaeota archaeon]|nr:hypothetical protein [Candidatus Brockarchaeota archaeon]MBO3808126.1 hypothetical protein [Candidatus Brockarchaeota archaeon]
MGEEKSSEEAPFSPLLNRSDVQVLLKALIDGALSELKPELNQAGEFIYPEAEKIMGSSTKSIKETLESLADEGILVREESATVLACPHCGDTRFLVDLSGAQPASPEARAKVIESIVSNLLGRRLICLAEKHVFHEGEGVPKKIYSYRLNENKKSLVEKWVMDLKPIVEALRAKGWRVDHPARIIGRSGVEHVFTLAVSYREESDSVDVLIDIIVSSRPVDESALSIVLKAMDVKADKKLLLVVPSLSDRARALFDYYKTYDVYILECQTISEINDALFEILTSLAKIKLKET